MKCLKCGSEVTGVFNTRAKLDGKIGKTIVSRDLGEHTWRRIECSVCSNRFTTRELYEKDLIALIEKANAFDAMSRLIVKHGVS